MLNNRIFLHKYRRMCYTIGGKDYAAGAVRNGYDSKADEIKFYLRGECRMRLDTASVLLRIIDG